jgi:diguanylate cyclase (GGDEF)-like protein/PAS domain S-box-containing protein
MVKVGFNVSMDGFAAAAQQSLENLLSVAGQALTRVAAATTDLADSNLSSLRSATQRRASCHGRVSPGVVSHHPRNHHRVSFIDACSATLCAPPDSRLPRLSAIVMSMRSTGMKIRQRSRLVRKQAVTGAHSQLDIGSANTSLDALVLLLTGDRDLIEVPATHARHESLALEFVDRLSKAAERLQTTNTVQALVVDLNHLNKLALKSLPLLMAAVPHLPVLLMGNEGELTRHASLLAQGAQDLLLKGLDARGFRRAVRNAITRKAREVAVSSINERARMTLASIGDAVLSTDSTWLVSFLNTIAEQLTGWTNAEAVGRHVSEVFQAVDGTTGERIAPQMELAIESGHTVILPPNCILARRDGRELHIEDSAAPIYDLSGEFAGMVVVFHDVSEARALTQKMSHLAQHDVLTALPNRALLDDRLERGITLARRHGRQMAVLFIDLDHFKHINDSLGHLIGDQLLKAVAQRIGPCIRNSDTVSRQGGDEFIVLLSEVNRAEDAGSIAEKIRLAVMQPYSIDGHFLHLTASIGVSVYPQDGQDAKALIQYADTAMYHAKEKGRNNSQFFKDDMNVRAAERQIITEDLRHALARNEFFLVYQPTINLVSGALTGFEALIRWRHPVRGILNPTAFVPIAEECGLIIPIGEWVLREACAQAQEWRAADLKIETMAVNVSAVEFHSDRFFDGVCRILRATGLEPSHLTLELTETAVMRNFEATGVVLKSLSTMGVRIAVDDFGTGYSNLSYLKRFPINTLKLDRSFIHDLPQSVDTGTIVSSVIRMAHCLHLRVVGEGVETVEQLRFLQAHDCEEGQGYYFSKPVAADECRSMLQLTKQRWEQQFLTPVLRLVK